MGGKVLAFWGRSGGGKLSGVGRCGEGARQTLAGRSGDTVAAPGTPLPTSPAAVGGFGLLFSADSQLRLSVSLSGGSQRRFSARPGDQSHAPESRGAKPGQPREGGCWDSPGGADFRKE